MRVRLTLLFAVTAACNDRAAPPIPTPADVALANAPPTDAWSAEVARHIAEDQRQPQAIAGGFALHAGSLHARLDASGIEVRDGGWRFDYDGASALPEVDGSRVVYRRGGGVTEWYEARPQGIEQGFTITELPAHGGDLVVRGRVESNEPARVVDDGVTFGDLRYDGLVVFDAAGRPLHASIEWDAEREMLALRVPADELAGAELPIVIDPLLSLATWTADPTEQADAKYGFMVAGAGDVNGDRYADVVVGAFGWDGAGANEGRAYLYLGSATGLAAAPAWIADPTDQAGAQFGVSVAGAGDVNGDGFGDVVIGANNWDGAAGDEGRAFVYLGSAAGLSALPAWTVDPTDQGSANFGNSVAGAGDVNGDGYADVLVSAPTWDSVFDEGRAYLYLGSASGLALSPAWTADPTNQASALFGIMVAGAGDVNGDGYADVVVNAHLWDGAATDEGRAYVYLGSSTGLAVSPAWTADPTDQASAQFGYSVAGAGDVNGDGFADVVIGAAGWDGAVASEGRAYVYMGSDTGLATTPAWTLDPTDQGAQFGSAVAGAGDVNGDGFADVLVAANAWDGAATDEGRVYLFLGGASGLALASAWTADPTDQGYASFGAWIAGAGDVNGDGFGDVVIGAPEWDGAATNEGRAYVYLGFATGLQAPAGWTSDPTDQASAFFGARLASAGDVNGDGFTDMIAGAPEWDGESSGEGRAYVYLGSAAGLAATAAWTADPTDQGTTFFGNAVVGAGDVNGDGFDDVIVGADRWDGPGASDEGRAYLYLGSASGLATSPSWTADPSDQVGAWFGASVAGAGDVNGDGYADVLVGARFWDGEAVDEGRSYLYLGGPTGLATTPAWTSDPTDQTGAEYGIAVAGAGDVNGDGFADALVGAYAWDGVSNEGQATLYLGGPTGLAASPSWTADPTDQPSAGFGVAVASAGDVNGDGYGDVVIGAWFWDGAAANEGRAYVYLGSASGLAASPSWTADPTDQVDARFGFSLASARDVNGDGFGDVVIAAYEWDGAGTDEGRAYVYLGGASGLATSPAWMADPTDQTNARFGHAVAGGDVNGDGFGDVSVGAAYWTGAATQEGRAYLYLGGDGAPGLARGLAQYREDGTTRLGVGNGAISTVVLKGRVTQEGPVGARLRLEVEVKPAGSAFDGTGTSLSAPVLAGQLATATVTGLTPGAYRWRARGVYPVGTGHGRWVAFGGNSEAEPDFRIDDSLQANGTTCAAGTQCVSGTCEDGLCCAVSCGLCNSCNAAGTTCGVQPADDATCGVVDCDLLDTTCRDYADLTANRCDALGMCEPANGAACVAFTDLSGPCSDGSACTSGDTCSGGACSGAAIVCSDMNGCTDDSCNPASGCVFLNNTTGCDDVSACTSGDTCAGGACMGGAAVMCDDMNGCTDDSCNPAFGCVFLNNTTGCDDGSACTSGDACLGGMCAGTTIVCDDTNQCTTNSCNPATGCVFTNFDMPCDDGVDCTVDEWCSGGVCSGGNNICDAGVPDAGFDAGAPGEDAGVPSDGGIDASIDAALAGQDAGGDEEDGFYACTCRVGSGRAPAFPATLLLIIGSAGLLLWRRRRGARR